MKTNKIITLLSLLVLVSLPVFSNTLTVTAGSVTSLDTQWGNLLNGDVLYIPDGTYTVSDTSFHFILADISNVLIIGESKEGTIIDFNGNIGIHVYAAQAVFKNLTIKNAMNSALYCDPDAQSGVNSIVSVENILFKDNVGYTGGALKYIVQDANSAYPISITDCEFVSNSCTTTNTRDYDGGGAIFIDAVVADLTIERNIFRGNSCYYRKDGAAMYINVIESDLTIENNVMHSNSGASSLYLGYSDATGKTLTMRNNTIAMNSASGIFFDNDFSGYTKNFDNNMIVDNTDDDIYGNLTLSGDYNIVENINGVSVSGTGNDIGSSGDYFTVSSNELVHTDFCIEKAFVKITSNYPDKDVYGNDRDDDYCDVGAFDVPYTTISLWKGNGNNSWTTGSNWRGGTYPGASGSSIADCDKILVYPCSSSTYPIIPSSITLSAGGHFDNTLLQVKSKGIFKNSGSVKFGSVYVESDDDNTGQFVNANSMTVSGDETYEQQLIANQWNFIGIPADVTAGNLLPDDDLGTSFTDGNAEYWLQYYDGDYRSNYDLGNNWKLITSSSYTLEANKGYIIWPGVNLKLKLKARPANNTVSVPAYSGTAGDNNKGWNLIANPYSIALNTDNVSSYSANSSFLNKAIYISDGSGGYYSRNGGVGDDEGTYIPGHQSFFIQVLSDNSTYTIPTSAAVYSTSIPFKSAKPISYITVTATDEKENADITYLRIEDGTSEVFDGAYDAYEMGSSGPLSLYSQLEDIDYSINTFSLDAAEQVIPLNLKLRANQTSFKLAFNSYAFDAYSAVLYDNQNGVSIPVNNDEELSFESTGADDSRFELRFYNSVTTPINAEEINDDFNVFSTSGGVKIVPEDDDIDYSFEIFDIAGRSVYNKSDACGVTEVELNNSGVFLLKVRKDHYYYSYKCVLNN